MNNEKSLPDLLDIKAVCAYFAVVKGTPYRWARKGLLHPVRLPNGRLRWRRADVEAFLDRSQTGGAR